MSSTPFLVGAIAYLWQRNQTFRNIDQGIGKIVEHAPSTEASLFSQLTEGLAALGFYIKKIFLPFPLNFAIDSISPGYLWLGVFSLLLLICITCFRTPGSFLVLLVFFTIGPALLNAVYHIAWTPYAERYLYLPTALVCSFWGTQRLRARPLPRLQTGSLLVIMIVMLSVTVHRNMQWMNFEAILADAVRQSPDNINLRINRAIVLETTAGAEAARDELHYAINKAPQRQEIRRVLASVALNSLDSPDTARDDLDIFFTGEQPPDEKTLEMMIDINNRRLAKKALPAIEIQSELFTSHRAMHHLTGDPGDLFHAARYAAKDSELLAATSLLNAIVADPATDRETMLKAKELLTDIPKVSR